MPTKVMGADLSMNHGAVVELTDGELTGEWYYTNIAGAAGRSDSATRWVPPKTKDKHIIQMTRLAFFETWFDKTVLMPNMPEYLGIEDYALDAGMNSQHTGEIGGTARILAWFRGIRLRLHDPTSIKMFAAHHGHADKVMMERAVATRWGATFGKYNGKPAKKGKPANRQTSEDLTDAYAVAKLVWTEVQLRRGEIKLSDLGHEKEIQVFNRLTKFMPMNLLDRDWIHKPDGTATPHGEPVCPTCQSRECCMAKIGPALEEFKAKADAALEKTKGVDPRNFGGPVKPPKTKAKKQKVKAKAKPTGRDASKVYCPNPPCGGSNIKAVEGGQYECQDCMCAWEPGFVERWSKVIQQI